MKDRVKSLKGSLFIPNFWYPNCCTLNCLAWKNIERDFSGHVDCRTRTLWWHDSFILFAIFFCTNTLWNEQRILWQKSCWKGVMYKVYGWWLGPNWPAADKYFYLQLTDEKIRAFATFNKKYFRPYSCNGSSSTAAANSVYSKP